MEKVLHDSFYVIKTDETGKTERKRPVKYDRSYAPYLLEAANNHLIQLEGRDSTQQAHDKFIHWCMEEYFKNGASPALLNTLNNNICVVGHQCHVAASKNQLMAIFVAHIPHKPPPTVFAAYMFSNMTSLGWLSGLRKCKNPECQHFFIGRPNARWCKKSCGSLVRVRKKRQASRKSNYL